MGVNVSSYFFHLLQGNIIISQTNIVNNISGKKEHILQDDPEIFSQVCLVEVTNIDVVDGDGALINIIKAAEEVDQG